MKLEIGGEPVYSWWERFRMWSSRGYRARMHREVETRMVWIILSQPLPDVPCGVHIERWFDEYGHTFVYTLFASDTGPTAGNIIEFRTTFKDEWEKRDWIQFKTNFMSTRVPLQSDREFERLGCTLQRRRKKKPVVNSTE